MTLDLEAIRKRDEAATPGPWRADEVRYGRHVERFVRTPTFNVSDDLSAADAEFIAHAREDIPALLAEIARLEGERDETRRYVRVLGRRQCTALIEDPEGQKHGCHYLVRAEEAEALAGKLNGGEELQSLMQMNNELLARATTAESALAACREENERLREGCRLYDLALKEAEAILGGEYTLRHGPLFDMAEAARALVERGAQ